MDEPKDYCKKKSVETIKYGLFAIKGRAFDKIIKQQLEVVQNLEHYLNEEVIYSFIFRIIQESFFKMI